MIRRASLAVVGRPVIDAPFEVGGADAHTPLPPSRAVTIFRVDRILKGSTGSGTIAVFHEVDPEACGLRFTAAKRYLLAFRMREADEPAPLRIGLCSVIALDGPNHGDGE